MVSHIYPLQDLNCFSPVSAVASQHLIPFEAAFTLEYRPPAIVMLTQLVSSHPLLQIQKVTWHPHPKSAPGGVTKRECPDAFRQLRGRICTSFQMANAKEQLLAI